MQEKKGRIFIVGGFYINLNLSLGKNVSFPVFSGLGPG
jgi:hypothetical protein